MELEEITTTSPSQDRLEKGKERASLISGVTASKKRKSGSIATGETRDASTLRDTIPIEVEKEVEDTPDDDEEDKKWTSKGEVLMECIEAGNFYGYQQTMRQMVHIAQLNTQNNEKSNMSNQFGQSSIVVRPSWTSVSNSNFTKVNQFRGYVVSSNSVRSR
jgi:hypothetical protein